MKRFTIVLGLLALIGVGQYCWKIYSYHQWFNTHLMGTVYTEMKERELAEILCQSFRYCGQGSSSKAYVSEDGRFVVKIFLKNKFQAKYCQHIPVIREFSNLRKTLKSKMNRSSGPIYAYQYIPKESGMIFYQFINQRNFFHRSLELIEKDGSISLLDLDKDEYLIQKRAVIVSEYLEGHLTRGDLEMVKSGISKLLRLTKTLYDQGIVLVVLQFLDNFGFVDDEPIRIDVEHLCFDPKWKETGKDHLRRELSTFRSWIAEHAPTEIREYFDAEVAVMALN